ncbi:hypothetical protein [Shimia sp. FJ5]|uniref:hypothetical protein n=1 Tax=Shimia sp. FJ5 TaxID=3079054 RepID=UPI002613ADC9|nr:hypothetical protein [Shimia sp. FJ5]MDV4144060.1 hypothetical protein [Shimia sp. FJ5]
MPLQNRVQPTGEILAHPARGRFMGNRGILHNAGQGLSHRRWRHKAWVCCLLSFKSRRRPLMAPGAYTELFFHDEAVALAAGHRPCGECRRADFTAFLDAAGHTGPVSAFDTRLHAARAIPRRFAQRRVEADAASLPDGTFILTGTGPALLWQGALHPFAPDGYRAPRPCPSGRVTCLTPTPTLTALRAGYRPSVALPLPLAENILG